MTQFVISEIDERLADFCHTASNPRRSLLIRILGDGEHTVTELVEATGFSATNVSQHLKLLRDKRLVAVTRQGGYARYRLANTKILEAQRAMREAFLECLQEDDLLRLAEAKRSRSPWANLEGPEQGGAADSRQPPESTSHP